MEHNGPHKTAEKKVVSKKRAEANGAIVFQIGYVDVAQHTDIRNASESALGPFFAYRAYVANFVQTVWLRVPSRTDERDYVSTL
ncbi:MAG: hypothetical protein L6R36_009002 [Xanthoria steineri]|nr:MAG: hypothetical protein L6R36_009002 [Xanthoria steineri]